HRSRGIWRRCGGRCACRTRLCARGSRRTVPRLARRSLPVMTVCWFATFRSRAASPPAIGDTELAWLEHRVASTPGLRQGLIYTASSTRDPYLDDGPPPQLVLQLYFDDIAELEAATARDGHLQALATSGALPSLDNAEITQQAMLVRRFPVPDPAFRTPSGELPCTYLVAYEGGAVDLHA